MENLDSINKLDKFAGRNLILLVTIGVIVYLLKIFKPITPFFINISFLPLIDLMIISSGIIGAKYFFTLRSRINKSLSLQSKIILYSKYTFFILVIMNVIYILNILVFLLTMSLIYIIIAGLLLVLYVVYRPRKEFFAENYLYK